MTDKTFVETAEEGRLAEQCAGVRHGPGLLTGCLPGYLPGRGLAAPPRESKVAQDWSRRVGGMLTEFVGDTKPGVSRWCGRLQNGHSK